MVNATYELLRNLWPSKPTYLPKDYPDLTGKVALITGCNTGIGFESAKALLKQNATVIFANRSEEKTKAAIEKIKEELGTSIIQRAIFVKTELDDLSSLKKTAETIKSKGISKIHYTILNAGVMTPPKGSKTKQDYELQIGIVFGHHLLQKFLTPLVLNAVTKDFTPRVAWLTSGAHHNSPPNGGIDWDSFHDASQCDQVPVYGQSKAAVIYLAYIYGQLYKDVISVAVHPGILASDLARSFSSFGQFVMKLIAYPTVYGSYTELFAALSPDVTLKDSGRYIGPWGEFRCIKDDVESGFTDGTAQKFWDRADEEVSKYYST